MPKITKKTLSREQQIKIRKEAILQAAFCEFTQKGFALARMEDIAQKASISKGSIYNYFTSKENLLEELVRVKILPLLPQEESIENNSLSVKEIAHKRLSYAMENILHGEAGMLLNLIIFEGERFPNISKMYHNLVIAKGIKFITQMLTVAWQRGELANKELIDCPQLFVAPIIQNFIWHKIFSVYHPIDFEKILKVFLDIIFIQPNKGSIEHE